MFISKENLKKIEDMTLTNYGAKKILGREELYIEDVNCISQLVENLLSHYLKLEEDLEDLKERLNYYQEEYCKNYSFD